jgi:predicted MPP superfamily phosphohydrolase
LLRKRRLVVPRNWPALEILHLSDLHLRRRDRASFLAQSRALARLPRQPDLVCVTGDLCEQPGDVPVVVELLRDLRPRLGMFLILGNHEYGAGGPPGVGYGEGFISRALGALYDGQLSSGADQADEIACALSRGGLQLLRNEGVRLQVGHKSLWVGGVDSAWAGRADPGAALEGRSTDEGALVLIHEPELAFAAVERGADVVLAGHTHGGQVCLPFVGPPYWHRMDPRLKVASGVQTIGGAQLHISAGTGQLLPLRFLCPPELVWLNCVRSS